MRLFEPASPRQLAIALTLARVITGITFVAHGSQKLFMVGIDGTTAGFESVGIPMASIAAPVVAIVELLGGLALIAGLLTRVAAVALAIVMLGAITMVHWSAGYFLPNGFEFALLLLVLNAALAIAGGGEYSVDALLARRGAPSGAPTAPQVQRAA